MKNYADLRIIAGILKFLGWATIVIGVVAFLIVILANSHNTPYTTAYVSPAATFMIGIAIAFSFFLSGILSLASGEAIGALVDIATNSANLPAIAASASKTVEFFERMSANANRPKTA